MTTQAMYRDKAKYYDLIYSWKNYQKESADLLSVLKKYQNSNGKRLLDVGCGTGAHLTYLSKKYTCTGVDVNPGILSIAKKKHPKVTFVKQDMRNLQVNQQFDAVVSLFSAIGYLKRESDLNKAIQRFADHLRPGGVLVIDPWFEPKDWTVGSPHLTPYKSKNICLARLNISQRKGNLAVMKMHWLVAEQNKEVRYFTDHHEMLLMPHNKILAMMRNAGLVTRKVRSKTWRNGLLVGVKA